MKINNRWFQLCASLVAMIMIANLQYTWTFFVKPLQQSTGWNLSEIQTAFTLFILFQSLVQPAQGWLIDRMGPRIFITVAGVLCGIGWAGMAYANTLPALYTLYVIAGIGAALVYAGAVGLSLKWFLQRRGLAAGIISAGFGGGTALFIPFISAYIRGHGYRATFLWSGILQGIVILLVAQFLRFPVAPPAAKPAQAKPPAAPKLGRHQYTTREMLSTPQFYLLYVAFVMMVTGGLFLSANAVSIGTSWGITAAAIATALSLSAVSNGLSRIFWGWVSDHVGRESTIIVAFSCHAVCLLGVAILGRLSSAWFTATFILALFTWGEIYALFPAILGDYYGTRHATSNAAVLYSAKGVASIFAGAVAAALFEHFGTWSACLYGSTTLAFLAAIIAFTLKATAAENAVAMASETGTA